MQSFPDDGSDLEVCYLTTTGRRSGRAHRIEIWFSVDSGVLYLVSGNGPGADWYRNALAQPEVTVELGDSARLGTARAVTDPVERSRVAALMGPKYHDYPGDPSIGLTFEAWRDEVPALAIENWRAAPQGSTPPR